MVVPLTPPPAACVRSSFSVVSPTLASPCFWFFASSHSGGYEVLSHFGFNLHFFNVEHLLKCYLAICIFSLAKRLFKSLPNFRNWVFVLLLSCLSSLYILDTNTLSDVWFTNIFSHSGACLFIFLMVSLKYKGLIFAKVEFNNSFMAHGFAVISESLPTLQSHVVFLLCFLP